MKITCTDGWPRTVKVLTGENELHGVVSIDVRMRSDEVVTAELVCSLPELDIEVLPRDVHVYLVDSVGRPVLITAAELRQLEKWRGEIE